MLTATANIAQAQVYGLKEDDDYSLSTQGDTWIFTITPPAALVGVLSPYHIPAPIRIVDSGNHPVKWVDGLAINSNGELFAYVNSIHGGTPSTLSGSTAKLVNIHKTTGEATDVGTVILTDAWIAGAAFDMNGNLWVINYIKDNQGHHQLLKIDPSTGIASFPIAVTGVTLDSTNSVDIAFDSDNQAYLSANDSVYLLDVTNGAVNLLHTFPVTYTSTQAHSPDIGGIAFYRNGEVWFAQGSRDDRIIYGTGIQALAFAHNAVLNLSTATGTENSGPMDLASWPVKVPISVPANNSIALISLALGMVGAGGVMLRRRRKQLQ
ncbi:MAG: hypothetical protein LBP52_01425 [Burkholderiaceae bacterium]|nr:hypothetical protein [Burkholderiaceae bacterium]